MVTLSRENREFKNWNTPPSSQIHTNHSIYMSSKRGISEISNCENVDSNKGDDVDQQQPLLKKQRQEIADEAFSGVDIRALINSDQPTVKCVLLDVNGEAKEIDVDMTPKKQEVTKLLGGQTSFVGQWEQIGVIVCCASQRDVSENVEKNPHKLQPPFHQAEVRGPIVLTRSGENGEPLDFTLSEYKEFQKLKIEEFTVSMEDLDEQDEEEDDNEEEEESEGDYDPENEEEDDEDDDGFDGFIDMLLGRVVQQFIEKQGREPDAAELKDLEDALRLKLGGGAPVEDDEEEQEEQEEEETKEDTTITNNTTTTDEAEEIDTKQVLDLLIAEFEKKHGRLPTNDEMKQWIVQLKEANMPISE